jgi:hypothetical protein
LNRFLFDHRQDCAAPPNRGVPEREFVVMKQVIEWAAGPLPRAAQRRNQERWAGVRDGEVANLCRRPKRRCEDLGHCRRSSARLPCREATGDRG